MNLLQITKIMCIILITQDHLDLEVIMMKKKKQNQGYIILQMAEFLDLKKLHKIVIYIAFNYRL